MKKTFKTRKIPKWEVRPAFRNFILGILIVLLSVFILIGISMGAKALNNWLDVLEIEEELEEASSEISFNEGRAKELWTRKKIIPLEIEKVKAEYERLQAEEQNITFQLTELEKQNILLDNRRQELNDILGEELHSAPAEEKKI